MTADAAQAWYAYNVLHAGNTLLPDKGVLPESRIEAIPFGPLTVLASLVPRALFDRESPSNRTADPEWMAARIEAHHAVNAAATEAGPCLPLAFGALFSSLHLLADWVGPRAATLQAALAQIAGKTEWALSLQEDVATHTAWLDLHDPSLQRLIEAATCAGEGTAFLMVRRLDKARAAARQMHITATVATVDQRLAKSKFYVLDELRQPGLPTWTILMPVQSSPPLASPFLDGLSQQVQALTADMAPSGLSLRLSGPWPAYAFARAALTEDRANA